MGNWINPKLNWAANNVVGAGDFNRIEGNTQYLKETVDTLTGSVTFFAMSTPPAGWLKCNGAAISRTIYANLFIAIGTTYGTGDGTTTFNLPDLRGEFIRGWDDGKGVDKERRFGSWQKDSFNIHQHGYQTNKADSNGSMSVFEGEILAVPNFMQARYWDRLTNLEGEHETRPRNVALLACIKY